MYDYLEDENNFIISLRNRYISHPSLSPKIYNKFYGEYSDVYAGFITEKDAGEKDITNFYSYYAGYKDSGFVQNIIAGNYSLSYGCGLVSGNLYNSYKTSDPFFPISKNHTKLSPYRSTDENKFFRGGAFTLKINRLFFTGFYSDNYNSGMAVKNHSRIGGLISEFNSGGFITSLLLSKYKSETSEDNITSFISLFAKLPLNKDIILQSETASDYMNCSSINILTFKVSKQLSFVSSIRTYNKNFYSLFGSAFGEHYGSGYNETGFYNGFRFSVKAFTVDLFYDQYKLTGPLDYEGSELMVRGTYKFSSISNLKLKYRSRLKEYTLTQGYDKRSFSGEYTLPVAKYLTYKIKGEYVKSGHHEDGFMLYNEVRYRKEEFQTECRFTTFKSMSYETALYVYEKDLPGLFTSKVLTGEGLRWYICSGYKLFNTLRLSLKYGALIKKSESLNYLGIQSDLEI